MLNLQTAPALRSQRRSADEAAPWSSAETAVTQISFKPAGPPAAVEMDRESGTDGGVGLAGPVQPVRSRLALRHAKHLLVAVLDCI